MYDSENIRDEIITIIVLMATLILTSSNLSPELFQQQSGESLPFTSVTDE